VVEESTVKIVNGWRRIDNERGYMNDISGQNIVVTKKEFGVHYVVLLFPRVKIDDKGETISPAYATASKAEAYAIDWMKKHPRGAEPAQEHTVDGGDIG
jgi:hypothetical protein